MKILIIEDDDYKLERLREFSKNYFENTIEIDISESLVEAIESIQEEEYDLIFVDMSIPSHPIKVGQGNPVSLLTGGLKVILTLNSMGRSDPCIIITQYPDIQISGISILTENVKEKVKELLDCEILECIYYKEESTDWETQLRSILKNSYL